ncbi:WYL domain-containing protein [Thalassotalea aquiviva]|uniref:WYL domain-containing protein n=1 Tax=Thalassotalea aquiviva TaxID=3242415 RepID=UPI00352B5C49
MTDIKLAERLAEIIGMLNNGEGINTSLLAERFNVSQRTIQRDIHQRLSFLDIDKSQQLWSLKKNKAGKLNKGIINKFADICGIKELFPTMDEHFLKELTDDESTSPYLVKPLNYEEFIMPTYRHQFKKLANAIKSQYQIDFFYNGKEYKKIEPYKLISYQGYWYLAGVDSQKIKTFQVGLIEMLWTSNVYFEKSSKIDEKIRQDETIWIGEEKFEVKLKVNSSISHYFKRRKILPEQKIVEALPEGSLMITTQVVNQKQVLSLIKCWLPNIYIVSPASMRSALTSELKKYLKE